MVRPHSYGNFQNPSQSFGSGKILLCPVFIMVTELSIAKGALFAREGSSKYRLLCWPKLTYNGSFIDSPTLVENTEFLTDA